MPTRPTYAEWVATLRRIDTCPWPGPRPLTALDRRSLLVGRAEDVAWFRRLVEDNRLVLLDGETGVGKTSLLQARLVPDLIDAGYIVASCRDWTDDGSPDAVAFLAEKVRAGLPNELPGGRSPAEFGTSAHFFGDLARALGRRSVIVLDQFEELIRYSESRTAEILESIIGLNHHSQVRIVVSLRSEYLHRLRPLDRAAKPYTISKYALEQIRDEFALDLVCAPNVDGRVIEDAAATLIAERWQAARNANGSGDAGESGAVGLLHLQALLYAVHAASAGAVVTVADVEKFLAEAGEGAPAHGLFALGMSRAVNVKLDRCERACDELHIDEYLAHGVRTLVARAAPQLSSAGFKLHRETGDLAEQVLGRELQSLRDAIVRATRFQYEQTDLAAVAAQQEALLRLLVDAILPIPDTTPRGPGARARVFDVLADDWSTIARRMGSDQGLTLADWVRARASDGQADPGDATCGPMMGMSPAAVLIEELRRLVFALAWMGHSSLIRLSTPAPSRTVVSLVHDRFGEAITSWASGMADRPGAAIHAFTAPKGASLEWESPNGAPLPELVGQDSHRLLTNLRWRGAFVSAAFERVLFVNCDLRGTMFFGCRFQGVGFLNCLLDGVMISNSTVVGAPGEQRDKWDPDPSRFMVDIGPDDGEIVAGLIHYRGEGTDRTALYSPLPGLPAVPWDRRAANGDTVDPTRWTRPSGGLVIYGGRVSTLVTRALTYEPLRDEPGVLSLRHVAGSGFDVVEQRSAGMVDIYGSALRHVTFSTSEIDASEPLAIEINGSAVSQLWIGDRITGIIKLVDCLAVHLWNGSADMDATIDDSTFHGAVGFAVTNGTALVGTERGLSIAEADPDCDVRQRAQAMDYRRDPARDERLRIVELNRAVEGPDGGG